MARFNYDCKLKQVSICNDESIFPAMRELVEKEGMTVRGAAALIEDDSKGQVTLNRAKGVYLRRSGSANRPLKRRDTVNVKNVNVFARWSEAMNKCLDFGSKILNDEVSWETSEEKRAVQDCFESVDKFLRLYGDKVAKKEINF